MNEQKLYGWHFTTGTLGYGDGRKVVEGKTLTVEGAKPSTCDFGLHASPMVYQAISYAPPNSYLTRVWVSGDIDQDEDKFCGLKRRCVKAFTPEETQRIMLTWAIRVLEDVFEIVPDVPEASKAVVPALKQFIAGEIDKKQMREIHDAADAARAAAADAADAARAADAAYAAAYAARAADAADAAYAAAYAARAAAYAARAAAIQKYSDWLEEIAMQALEEAR